MSSEFKSKHPTTRIHYGVLGERPTDEELKKIYNELVLKGDILVRRYYTLDGITKFYLSRFEQYDTKELVINDLALYPLRITNAPLFIPIRPSYTNRPIYGIERLYKEILGGPYFPSDVSKDLDMFGSDKNFLKSLMFSIFIDCILLNIGHITSEIDKVYKIVLIGGLSLKYYNKSHITRDCDIKIYPTNIELYDVKYAKEYVLNKFNNLVKYLSNHYKILVENYLRVLESHGISDDRLLTFSHNFRNINNKMEFEIQPGEYNPNVYKLLLIHDGRYYKLCDISLYDPEDEQSKKLHQETMEKLYGKDTEKVNVPTEKISIELENRFTHKNFINYINVPSLDFLRIDKNILLDDILGKKFKYHNVEDPSTFNYYLPKWQRAVSSIKSIIDERDYHSRERARFIIKYQTYKNRYLELKNRK